MSSEDKRLGSAVTLNNCNNCAFSMTNSCVFIMIPLLSFVVSVCPLSLLCLLVCFAEKEDDMGMQMM